MKPGVLPDSGNHINFAPTLAVDGGGDKFHKFSPKLEIFCKNYDFSFFFLDLFREKNKWKKGFCL